MTVGISLLAVPMLVAGAFGQLLVAAALLQLASVLDGLDGELARRSRRESPLGAHLDTVSDYFLDAAGVIAIGMALLANGSVAPSVVLGVVGATIAARLVSQYTKKMIPDSQGRWFRDSRDVVTLAILASALLYGLLGPWVVLGTLAGISLWRLDSTLFRLLALGRRERVGESE